jgi:hypothetical protein
MSAIWDAYPAVAGQLQSLLTLGAAGSNEPKVALVWLSGYEHSVAIS